MNSQSLLAVIAAFVMGVAGVAVGTMISDDGEAVVATESASEETLRVLSERVDRVTDQNREMVDRLQSIELQLMSLSAEANARPEPVVLAEVQPVVEDPEVDAVVAALTDSDSALPETFTEKIGDVVQALRDEERRQRDEERDQARADALEQRLEELAKELQLDAYQVNGMRDIFADSQTKRGELFETARATNDWGNLRESMETIRGEADEALGQLLSPTQMEQYEEAQGGWGGFGGGGGGGRRGWGGGG